MILLFISLVSMAIASMLNNHLMACFGFALFCLPQVAVIAQSEVK